MVLPGILFLCALIVLVKQVNLGSAELSERRTEGEEARGTSGEKSSSYWLDDLEALSIQDKIEKYLNQEKAFLKQGFCVADLTEAVGVSRHQLAACFTQAYDSNFNKVINRRRVEYGLREMDSEVWDRYTVEGMAYHLGFGSRSTFTTVFKKVTGMTPAEYRRSRKSLQLKVPGSNISDPWH